MSVDQLIDRLWPDDPVPSRPEEQVAVLVSRLRGVLGPDRLPRRDAGYQLLADWLDVDALAALVTESGRRLALGSYALARASAEAALTLARGPVLADGPEADWVLPHRAAAERLIATARHVAARAALLTADYVTAAELASRALDTDPYDEAALQLLMRARAAAGSPASALAAYARARQRLADDLGVDPAPETEQLHLALLRQEPLPEGRTRPTTVVLRPGPGIVRGPAQLPGRETELVELDAALERAASGALEIVSVEGEAGIGKTRLLEVWTCRAAAVGALVLQARCDELERNLPLQPVLDALDGYLHTLPTPESVHALLGAEHALLGPFLRASSPGPSAVPIDPAAGQAMLFAALLAVFTRLTIWAPSVLAIDDLHLADRATVEWLHFMARRGVPGRLLVVGAVRPEEGVPLPRAQRLCLGPLDLAATRLIVGAERADALHARSGGHPLFLVELAAAEDDATLPASLRDAIAARCDRATPEAAATLRAAALLGPTVDLDMLAGVLSASPLDVLAYLEEGVRRQLLEERGSMFAFRHALVREALATDLGATRRVVLHRAAARVLAARRQRDPLEVAHHAREGRDVELAAASLAEAALRATERYDHAESERLLDLAIELSDSASSRLQRARTRNVRGDYQGAEADALVALDRGAGAAALEVAAWAAYYRRDFTAARRYGEDGAEWSSGAIRSRCLAIAGRTYQAGGHLAAAEACLEEALRAVENPRERVAPAVWLAILRCYQGCPGEALLLAEPAVRARHAPDLQLLPIYAHLTTTYALAALGRAAEALNALDTWDAEMERQHATRFRHRPANFRAWVLRGLGDVATADELNRRAAEEARLDGAAEPEIHAWLGLAEGRLHVGDLDGARSCLSAVEPLLVKTRANRWRLQLRDLLLRARLALASGRPVEARSLAAALRNDAAALRARRYEDLAYLLSVEAATALGEPIDLPAVATVLERLPNYAGLEAWWLTADVAAVTRAEPFWSLAEAHAARLASRAGPHAEAFRRYAAARLEKMRTADRRG